MPRRDPLFRAITPLLVTLALAACGDDGKQTSMTGTMSTTTGAGTTSTGSTTAVETTGTGTGTTTAVTDGTTGTSSGSTTCSFVDCNTTGMTDVQCDIWNDDCPDGSKCMPWANDGGNSWNATKCTPIDPSPGKPGDPCKVEGSGVSGIDNCEKGSMCWDVNPETQEGYCVGFCDGSPESYTCAEPNTTCTILNNGTLILCLPGCDPLLQDCPNMNVCVPNPNGGFTCILDASGDMGKFQDPCEFVNVCDPGLVCLNPEYVPECQAGGCCSPYCELDADYTTIPAPTPKCPDPAMACLAWYEMDGAPPGQEKIGVCGIQQ